MKLTTKKMAFIAIFAAVNYVVFTYGKINISIMPGSTTAIHVANAVVVLSALLMGPIEGGIAGAIGLSIADLFDPRYILSAPKTFFLKFMIAFIAGTVAKKLNLSKTENNKQTIKVVLISAIAGLGFNVIFDPIIGYVWKKYVLKIGAEAASIILAWTGGVTLFNAIVCVFVSTLLYMMLYKSFQHLTSSSK